MTSGGKDADRELSDTQSNLGRERAEFALAERAAKIGYWRLDLTTGQVVWSPGMYSLLGIAPADRRANNDWLRDQIVPEDVLELERVVAEAIKSRSPFYCRSRAKDTDATVKIVDTHGEVELGSDGRVCTVIGVCQDVTGEVAAEVARRRAEEMYRAMAEQASDIIILYDAEGRIEYASQALERVLGRSPAEIDDKRHLEIIHPDDLEMIAKLDETPQPGETLTATYRARHGDGHYVWIEASTRGIYDENGELRNLIGVSRDITDRRLREFATAAARDRAEAANLAKSTFLANMSHELRTPLNAIIGFADIMQQQMFGPLGAPRYGEYARLIHQSGELLLDLISDVLDMAKIEAGKLELHIGQVELRGLIADTTRLLQTRANDGQVKLRMELPEGDLFLDADRRALKQIVLNLLSNAVKFTLPGGTVTTRAALIEGCIRIEVADDGIGIPASELPRLGRPFEQVTTDPTLSKGGTGLGLALVHALAEKHGGRVHIDSVEGQGTTVTVELPAQQQGDGRAAA